eukprot:s3177_g3.t1
MSHHSPSSQLAGLGCATICYITAEFTRQVRHCNFTERGYHSRNYARARIMARAMTVLADRKLLPDQDVRRPQGLLEKVWLTPEIDSQVKSHECGSIFSICLLAIPDLTSVTAMVAMRMGRRSRSRRWMVAILGLMFGAPLGFLNPRLMAPLVWAAHSAAAKAASVGFTFQETKALPSWTPPWASWPPMMQVGVFLFALAMVAAVTPILLGQGFFGLKVEKPKTQKSAAPPKEEMKLGVTDDLFDPSKRKTRVFQTESAAAATSRASTPADGVSSPAEPLEPVEPVEVEAEKSKVSAWERLKEGL